MYTGRNGLFVGYIPFLANLHPCLAKQFDIKSWQTNLRTILQIEIVLPEIRWKNWIWLLCNTESLPITWCFRLVQKMGKMKPRILCKGNGAISHLQTKMGFLRTSVTACMIHKNIFSAPFRISYMRTEIWKKKFWKISYTTPQWGASHLQTPISKWELPQWGLQRTLGTIN